MKKACTYLIFSICLFLACNEPIEIDPETGFEIFTINSGQHSSITRSEAFTGTGINVTVQFDESAEYTLERTNNQADINKLVGFSDCGQHHQSESARFGWRWFDSELQILAYVYREGNLHFELMGAVAMNQSIDLSLRVENDQYRFSGDGLQTVNIARTGNCEAGENYWLWPYFGGDETAPHAIRIQLKREVID